MEERRRNQTCPAGEACVIERLTRIEERQENMLAVLTGNGDPENGIVHRTRSLEKLVWKAGGAVGAFMIVIEVLHSAGWLR